MNNLKSYDLINGNFTEFIRNKKVLLFSDSEGYLSTGIKERIIEHVKDRENNRFIFNGDITDYTNASAFMREDFRKKGRFCFLELMKLINDSPNAIATFGNRELNKTAIFHLVQFNDYSRWWADYRWDSSRSNFENIDAIASQLYGRPDNIPWMVKSMADFFPYWLYGNSTLDQWVGWKSAAEMSIYDRYVTIFGTYPFGLMAAQNTMKGLLIELAGDEGVAYVEELFVLEEKEKDKQNPITPEEIITLNTLRNKYAAITFTIYARILDPKLYGSGQWEYDGCFFHYLMSNPFVGYANKSVKDKLYLFSHGGVSSLFNFTNLLEEIKGKYAVFKENALGKYKPDILKKISDKKAQTTQNGGAINSTVDIIKVNRELKDTIGEFYAMFEGKINPAELETPTLFGFMIYSFILFDTNLMPGYEKITKDTGLIYTGLEKYEIFNIFGHSPVGFGYGFGRSQNGSIYMCSDFSNTFLKNTRNNPPVNFDSNNLVLYFDFDNNEFYLDGEIYVFKTKLQITMPDGTVKILLSPDLEQNFDSLPSIIPIKYENYRIDFNKLDKTYVEPFHGTAKINIGGVDKMVDVYTIKGQNFAVNLKLVSVAPSDVSEANRNKRTNVAANNNNGATASSTKGGYYNKNKRTSKNKTKTKGKTKRTSKAKRTKKHHTK